MAYLIADFEWLNVYHSRQKAKLLKDHQSSILSPERLTVAVFSFQNEFM